MARYVSLLKWTDQGIRGVKETVSRAQAARRAFEAAGGRFVDVYWTLGEHDVVLIFEAPEDETAMRLVLSLGTKGNVRSTTMRAFGEAEMGRIVEQVQ
ncbi:MAG TPA: GYD domain-containing protein [Burkholderiales bacterium]|nr:GYD domain-containing protein [Burkholderiales bacterium]